MYLVTVLFTIIHQSTSHLIIIIILISIISIIMISIIIIVINIYMAVPIYDNQWTTSRSVLSNGKPIVAATPTEARHTLSKPC